MTEDDFLSRWETERPMYEAWGHYVVSRIVDAIKSRLSPFSADLFLRLPPKPRLKGGSSIIEKAFYRDKNYGDPYGDITDKVGVRFVVLLGTDIKIVQAEIEGVDEWIASKDRDYEEEQHENPVQFDYAAVHYIVRSKNELTVSDHKILAGTPCEVQVKTILQHAYSELTHDTIYKPKITATPDMLRAAAKSMALIEATNDYFELLDRKVADLAGPNKSISEQIAPIYSEYIKQEPEPTKAEGLLLDAFGTLGQDLETLRKLLSDKPFIADTIRKRAATKLLFRQPSILLVYKAATDKPSETKGRWPFTPDELRPIYTDLGLSFDGA